jgi:hypothetical protein
MFEYTKDNHLKLETVDGVFGVTIGSCNRTPHSFKEECILAAKEIASKTDKTIYVNYSDLSSQVICHAFAEAGVRFTAVNYVMTPRFNRYQSANAKSFFESMGMRYITLPINMREYFGAFHQTTKLPHNKLNLQAFVQSKLDGVFISTQHMFCLNRKQQMHAEFQKLGKNKFYDVFGYEPCSIEISDDNLFNYYTTNNIDCIPEFFFYTPELLYSLLSSTQVEQYIDATDYMSTYKYEVIFKDLILPILYKQHWPNLVPMKLYEGIELIDEIAAYDKLATHFEQYVDDKRPNIVNIPHTDLLTNMRIMHNSKQWKSEDSRDYFMKFLKKH